MFNGPKSMLLEKRADGRSMADAFWERVVKDPESGCWHWIGTTTERGHGVFNGKWKVTLSPRRVSAVLADLPLTDTSFVQLTCGCTDCVNPAHFDIVEKLPYKGHWVKGWDAPKGEASGAAKLSDEQVVAMRADWAQGMSLADLTKKYGVGGGHASMICRGKKWKHLTEGIGEKRVIWRMSAADVPAIRERLANGETRTQIAESYGVTISAVTHLLKRNPEG